MLQESRRQRSTRVACLSCGSDDHALGEAAAHGCRSRLPLTAAADLARGAALAKQPV
jgi:hypothetical protein